MTQRGSPLQGEPGQAHQQQTRRDGAGGRVVWETGGAEGRGGVGTRRRRRGRREE